MATGPTLSVQVKFDNGPTIDSKGTLDDSGSYIHFTKDICRLASVKGFTLNAGPLSEIAMIIVSADKYAPDKDTCQGAVSNDRRIQFGFKDNVDLCCLNGPFVVRYPLTNNLKVTTCAQSGQPTTSDKLDKIWIANGMPIDAKVSVLVVRLDPDRMPCDPCANGTPAAQVPAGQAAPRP